jgi:hypothetical protein
MISLEIVGAVGPPLDTSLLFNPVLIVLCVGCVVCCNAVHRRFCSSDFCMRGQKPARAASRDREVYPATTSTCDPYLESDQFQSPEKPPLRWDPQHRNARSDGWSLQGHRSVTPKVATKLSSIQRSGSPSSRRVVETTEAHLSQNVPFATAKDVTKSSGWGGSQRTGGLVLVKYCL